MRDKMKNKLRLELIRDLTTAKSLDSFILNMNRRLEKAGFIGIEAVINRVMNDE